MRTGPTRDHGVVLRQIALGDTSKIVSVLTPEFGRVKLVAKGSRQINSRLGPLLEPGNELDLVFYPHRDRDLWMLKEAGLRRAALTGGGSLSKLSHLFAALELTDRLLPEREAVPEFAALLDGFMEAWHRGVDATMSGLFFAFELRWLAGSGLGLDPVHCSECGETLDVFERVRFHVAEGTFVCPQCGIGGGRWIDDLTVAALAEIDGYDFSEAAFRDAVALPPLARREVGRLLHEHMVFHLPNYRLPQALYWLAPSRDVASDRP